MIRTRGELGIYLVVAMLALAVPTIPAEGGEAYVIARPPRGLVRSYPAPSDPVRIARLYGHHGQIVARYAQHVVEQGAVVDRDLSLQPVHPHVSTLRMGSTTVYVDAYTNFKYHKSHRPSGAMDSNHSILKAQRAYRQYLARQLAAPTRVIRRDSAPSDERTIILPRAILLKPFDQRPNIPVVPAPPKRKSKQMAHGGSGASAF